MNENQKQATSFGIGGGVGFLLGWLLRRPKTVASGIVLSNLTIDPPSAFVGQKVYIEVDATNTGATPATGTLVLHAGNRVQTADVSLGPGEMIQQGWNYQVEEVFGGTESTVRVTVSVDALRGDIFIGAPA